MLRQFTSSIPKQGVERHFCNYCEHDAEHPVEFPHQLWKELRWWVGDILRKSFFTVEDICRSVINQFETDRANRTVC